MSDIVKGWAKMIDDGVVTVYRYKARAGERPVLLIPDDGSRVVVSREEWERMTAPRVKRCSSKGCTAPATHVCIGTRVRGPHKRTRARYYRCVKHLLGNAAEPAREMTWPLTGEPEWHAEDCPRFDGGCGFGACNCGYQEESDGRDR